MYPTDPAVAIAAINTMYQIVRDRAHEARRAELAQAAWTLTGFALGMFLPVRDPNVVGATSAEAPAPAVASIEHAQLVELRDKTEELVELLLAQPAESALPANLKDVLLAVLKQQVLPVVLDLLLKNLLTR